MGCIMSSLREPLVPVAAGVLALKPKLGDTIQVKWAVMGGAPLYQLSFSGSLLQQKGR